MSNQVILWSMFILPWFSLFFMKRVDIKRYMPVALFATTTSILIAEIGDTLKWWSFMETAYPLHNMSYIYGLNPVSLLWIMKFTYRKFGVFIIADAILNLGFAYLLLGYFLHSRGIFSYLTLTPFHVLLITTVHGIISYGYQLWQESVLAWSERTRFSAGLQPAAAKPLQNDLDQKEDYELYRK